MFFQNLETSEAGHRVLWGLTKILELRHTVVRSLNCLCCKPHLIVLIREKLPKTKLHTRSLETVEKVKIKMNFIGIFRAFKSFVFLCISERFESPWELHSAKKICQSNPYLVLGTGKIEEWPIEMTRMRISHYYSSKALFNLLSIQTFESLWFQP